MIYLDYSANTPADPAVLRTFVETEQRYIGNANSTHAAGRAAHARMDEILAHTAQLLGVQPDELIFTSGELMTGLVQEIEKIAAAEPEENVSFDTINKVAHHLPEARIFEMTDAVAAKKFDNAASTLAELMQSGEHPIKTLAMIGMQMRRLYAARLAIDKELGRDYVMAVCHMNYPTHADNLLRSARGFSLSQLKNYVALCAEYDYRMKSSAQDDDALLKELFLKIAVGESA